MCILNSIYYSSEGAWRRWIDTLLKYIIYIHYTSSVFIVTLSVHSSTLDFRQPNIHSPNYA